MATFTNVLITELIEELIASLRETSPITVVLDNGNGTFTLTTDSLESLVDGDFVTFMAGTEKYQISNVGSLKFTVTAGAGFNPTSWTACNPWYFHGTARRMNAEYTADNDINDLSNGQFVFFMEVQTDTLQNDPMSNLLQESEIRIFFMKRTNIIDNDSDDFWTDDISPMQILANEFIEAINTDGRFRKPTPITRANYATWGDFIKEIGIDDWKMDEQFGGTGLAFTLPIKTNAVVCTP